MPPADLRKSRFCLPYLLNHCAILSRCVTLDYGDAPALAIDAKRGATGPRASIRLNCNYPQEHEPDQSNGTKGADTPAALSGLNELRALIFRWPTVQRASEKTFLDKRGLRFANANLLVV